MVLLTKISESAIVENLKKRLFDDQIFVSFLCHHNYCRSSISYVSVSVYGNGCYCITLTEL